MKKGQFSRAVQTEAQKRRPHRQLSFLVALCSCLFFALFATLTTLTPAAASAQAAPSLPFGVAAGDVTQDSAVLWAYSTAAGPISFSYGTDLNAGPTVINRTVVDTNLPVSVTVTGLTADNIYQYRVTTAAGESEDGVFRTAANVGTRTGLRFGVGAENDGALASYPSIRNVPARDLEFFHLHGDGVYTDDESLALPFKATTVEEYRQKYAQVYTPTLGLNTWSDLRASTSLLATIDDHEIVNNFAGGASPTEFSGFPETDGLVNDTARYEAGMQVFQEFYPLQSRFYGTVGGDGRMDNERKLYRYQQYGSDAAFIVLDTRSFRDLQISDINFTDIPTDAIRFLGESLSLPRTILGSQQFDDLKNDLLDAQSQGITWKFVAVPEPIQNLAPIGGADRFEGYANERTQLLQFIEDNEIKNVVFVAADLHGLIVNNLTYQTALGTAQLDSSAFEIVVGPVARSTYGELLIGLAISVGAITPDQAAFYDSLPVSPDPDEALNDKDDFLRTLLNQQIAQFGYDAVGLEGSNIDATLVQGDYFVVHQYVWTEFDIDQETQVLTVTTYGVNSYTVEDIAADAAAIAALQPEIVSQFVVNPVMAPTALTEVEEPAQGQFIYLPVVVQ